MAGLCRRDSMAYRTGVASHVQFSGGFRVRKNKGKIFVFRCARCFGWRAVAVGQTGPVERGGPRTSGLAGGERSTLAGLKKKRWKIFVFFRCARCFGWRAVAVGQT